MRIIESIHGDAYDINRREILVNCHNSFCLGAFFPRTMRGVLFGLVVIVGIVFAAQNPGMSSLRVGDGEIKE